MNGKDIWSQLKAPIHAEYTHYNSIIDMTLEEKQNKCSKKK